jgi:hypothetical protein
MLMSATVRWRVPAIARRAVTMVPAVVVLAAGVNQVTALV